MFGGGLGGHEARPACALQLASVMRSSHPLHHRISIPNAGLPSRTLLCRTPQRCAPPRVPPSSSACCSRSHGCACAPPLLPPAAAAAQRQALPCSSLCMLQALLTTCRPPAPRCPQAFCELRSARVDRGVAPQRASYHLRSLGRFLGAGRSFTAELRPVALLLLALHSQQRWVGRRLAAGCVERGQLAAAGSLAVCVLSASCPAPRPPAGSPTTAWLPVWSSWRRWLWPPRCASGSPSSAAGVIWQRCRAWAMAAPGCKRMRSRRASLARRRCQRRCS